MELPFSSTSNSAAKIEFEVDCKPEDVELQEVEVDDEHRDIIVRVL